MSSMRDAPASHPRTTAVIGVMSAAVALVISAWIVRPIHPMLVGSDTASSVLYFDRIIDGETLERFLGTTPKPLLTVVDGLLHAVTNDWRPIAWMALLVYALAIGATALLAARVSGPVSGAFVGTALIASPGLLQDAALAYAVSWALLAVSVACLAVTAAPPRNVLAGLALAAGGLARQEVIIVSGVAATIVFIRYVSGATGGRSRPPRGELWLLLGLAAVPVTMFHDLLLASDPFYTWKVSSLGAVGRLVGGLPAAIQVIADSLSSGGFVLLAMVGLLVLYRRREWPVLIGLLATLIGVAMVVGVVGARGLVVLDRYALPIQIAIIFAAGSGLAAIRMPALNGSMRGYAMPIIAVVVAVILTPRIGPIDGETTGRIRTGARAAGEYTALLPSLRAAVDAAPILRMPPASRDPSARGLSEPALYVTPGLLPAVLVDLDLRLDRVARLTALDPNGSPPPIGTIILHIKRIETTPDASWTEVDAATERFGRTLKPIDRIDRHAWLVRVDPEQP